MLTVPVFYPVILELQFAGVPPELVMVWFGIIVVVVTEISLITPPIGMNVFVLKAMLPDIKTGTIFRGVTPFRARSRGSNRSPALRTTPLTVERRVRESILSTCPAYRRS